jgi:hypothetical protein
VEGHLNLCACAGKLSYENQGNAFSWVQETIKCSIWTLQQKV